MQVCTSLQTDNHASTPPLIFFAGRMPFLPPNQQCQSTEGSEKKVTLNIPHLSLPHCCRQFKDTTHTHNRLTAVFLGSLGWAGTRKVKPIWILQKQETMSGTGISWAMCKSAFRSRQITTPAPRHSVFFAGQQWKESHTKHSSASVCHV